MFGKLGIGAHKQRMPQREVGAEARLWHQRRYSEAVDFIAHGVLVAVPVGDDERQARGHRIHRRQAETFLDVVG